MFVPAISWLRVQNRVLGQTDFKYFGRYDRGINRKERMDRKDSVDFAIGISLRSLRSLWLSKPASRVSSK